MSAKSVPSWMPPQILAGQGFLTNGTQCTQKKRKTFLEEAIGKVWLVNHPTSHSKRIGKMWVPSVPMPTIPGKTRFCGITHSSTQHKGPSTVHRIWVPKSILDGISSRSIKLAESNKRRPMLTQDKRWIWWAPLSNAAVDRRNGYPRTIHRDQSESSLFLACQVTQ